MKLERDRIETPKEYIFFIKYKQLNYTYRVLKSSFTSKSDLSYTCSLEQKKYLESPLLFSQINKSAKICHNKFNKKFKFTQTSRDSAFAQK